MASTSAAPIPAPSPPNDRDAHSGDGIRWVRERRDGLVASAPRGVTFRHWLPVAIVSSVFLTGAGILHLVEIVRERNFSPGNTIVLLYDFGVPAALWPLLLATGAI